MERPASPDPISDPKGYQNHLLGLLGDDDPAAVQARTPAALRQMATEAGPNLFLRPEPQEWSAFECMAHITDAEIVMSARYRWVLAHDEPPLIGYDQDLWVDRLHVDDDGLDSLLDLFDARHNAPAELFDQTGSRVHGCQPGFHIRQPSTKLANRGAGRLLHIAYGFFVGPEDR